MTKAIWQNVVIAESEATVSLEGNAYFPKDSIKSEYFRDSTATTSCPWKGTANYFDVVVDGEVNQQAAWYYDDPKPEAANIKGFVAFWKGVEVTSG